MQQRFPKPGTGSMKSRQVGQILISANSLSHPHPIHPPRTAPQATYRPTIPTHGLSEYQSPEKQKGHLLDGLMIRISLGNCVKMLEKFCGSPTWTRTRDLRINSPSLYRLSYQGIDEGAILLAMGYSVNYFTRYFAKNTMQKTRRTEILRQAGTHTGEGRTGWPES